MSWCALVFILFILLPLPLQAEELLFTPKLGLQLLPELSCTSKDPAYCVRPLPQNLQVTAPVVEDPDWYVAPPGSDTPKPQYVGCQSEAQYLLVLTEALQGNPAWLWPTWSYARNAPLQHRQPPTPAFLTLCVPQPSGLTGLPNIRLQAGYTPDWLFMEKVWATRAVPTPVELFLVTPNPCMPMQLAGIQEQTCNGCCCRQMPDMLRLRMKSRAGTVLAETNAATPYPIHPMNPRHASIFP